MPKISSPKANQYKQYTMTKKETSKSENQNIGRKNIRELEYQTLKKNFLMFWCSDILPTDLLVSGYAFDLFGILVIRICDLFVICNLLLVI